LPWIRIITILFRTAGKLDAECQKRGECPLVLRGEHGLTHRYALSGSHHQR
jgi:hypothetical protein